MTESDEASGWKHQAEVDTLIAAVIGLEMGVKLQW